MDTNHWHRILQIADGNQQLCDLQETYCKIDWTKNGRLAIIHMTNLRKSWSSTSVDWEHEFCNFNNHVSGDRNQLRRFFMALLTKGNATIKQSDEDGLKVEFTHAIEDLGISLRMTAHCMENNCEQHYQLLIKPLIQATTVLANLVDVTAKGTESKFEDLASNEKDNFNLCLQSIYLVERAKGRLEKTDLGSESQSPNALSATINPTQQIGDSIRTNDNKDESPLSSPMKRRKPLRL